MFRTSADHDACLAVEKAIIRDSPAAHLVIEIHSRHPRGLNPHAHGVADVREDRVADRIAPVDKRRAALATGVERTRVGRLIRAAIEPIAIKDAIDSSEGGVGVRFVATTY